MGEARFKRVNNAKEHAVYVDGIVAQRDKLPYIRLFKGDNQVAQLSVAQARQFAENILTMAARTEADAMILKFFDRQDYPEGAAAALMMEFRQFRYGLDQDVEPTIHTEPDLGIDIGGPDYGKPQ